MSFAEHQTGPSPNTATSSTKGCAEYVGLPPSSVYTAQAPYPTPGQTVNFKRASLYRATESVQGRRALRSSVESEDRTCRTSSALPINYPQDVPNERCVSSLRAGVAWQGSVQLLGENILRPTSFPDRIVYMLLGFRTKIALIFLATFLALRARACKPLHHS